MSFGGSILKSALFPALSSVLLKFFQLEKLAFGLIGKDVWNSSKFPALTHEDESAVKRLYRNAKELSSLPSRDIDVGRGHLR